MKLHSLRFEISILHTAILAVILIVFSTILYFISKATFQRVDKQLIIKAQAIDAAIVSYRDALGDTPDALTKAVQKMITMKSEGFILTPLRKVSIDWVSQVMSLGLTRDYINFFNKNTKVVISSANMNKELSDAFIEDSYMTGRVKVMYKTLKYHNKGIRVITYPLYGNKSAKYFIQVGMSQDPVLQQLSNYLVTMLVIFPLILLLTSYAGSRQAARILAPVNQITDMANKITHQDLRARIKAKHFDPEMGLLIDAFNDMIARLENSFNHIEEFSHHVAHELKTPLTIIKAEADLLLRKERSVQEYQQALKITLEESERVLKTVEDLLLLAKLDYQPEIFNFEVFSFKEFFNEVSEQSQLLAMSKKIEIVVNIGDIESSVMVKGDRLHLRRLFFNIIDNAFKFTPKQGKITIDVYIKDGRICTAITDTGPGISQENKNKIFDKFFRINNVTTGNGLGLSIASTIARIHHGSILVDSKLGHGTTFRINLPIT